MVAEQLQGSNTVIVPLKTGFVHPIISGQDGTIGLRIPNHNFGIDLVSQLGKPITTTSVNHSGMPPLNKVDDIMELFGSSFDLLIDAGDLPPSKGSKVIKLTKTHFEIIRK
jgi:L-threonylcarbamoyladenylate synthase